LVVGAGGPLVSLRSLSGDLLVVPPTPVALPAVAPVAAEPPRPPEAPVAPEPPRPPEAPVAPEPPVSAQNSAIAAAYDDARLRILRSLERGEIDVAEAGQRLEALDGIDPLDEPESATDADAPAVETTAEADDADDVDGTETARFDPNARTDA
jgi:hypothetical protein